MPSRDEKRLKKMERRRLEREMMAAEGSAQRFWKKAIGIGGGAVVVVVIFVVLSSGVLTLDGPHPYDPFAQCLAQKGLVLYGVDWCPTCQDQKKMFGKAFEEIPYVNCDFDRVECQRKKIDKYPTWYLNGELFEIGVQSFPQLAEATGCEIPEDL